MQQVAKLVISGSENDAADRFCKLYQGRAGKQELLHELIKSGMVLKETGLVDIILNLDQNPDFRNAPNTQKTRMLLVELRHIFGGVAPETSAEVQSVAPVSTAPAPEAEPVSTEKSQKPAAPVKKPVPNLGV